MRLLLFLAFLSRVNAGDWPQFLGPLRDGKAAADEKLITEVPDGGFKTLWKRSCGAGFAGPVVSGGRVVLFHRTGDENTVEAMEADTGKVLWKTGWATAYRDDFGFDEGPRSCPAIDGGVVYCYGADGTLAALALEDGKLLWQKDLAAELGSAKGFFGRSCAPLVTGGLVLLAPGGEGAGVAAFAAKTGALKWKALDTEAGYASPILMHPPQGPRVVFFTREGVSGVMPESGKVVFEQPFRAKMHASVNASTPVAVDATHFFTSACYDTGAALWEMGRDDKLTATWRSGGRLDCHYGTPVLVAGNLYGFHGRQETGQELRCVSAMAGKVLWAHPLDAGHVIAVGNRLVILTDAGELILTEANPDKKPDLRARSEIIRGGHRAPPAIAGGRLYARDKSQFVCVDLGVPK